MKMKFFSKQTLLVMEPPSVGHLNPSLVNCPLSSLNNAFWVGSILIYTSIVVTNSSLLVSFTELSWFVLSLHDDYQFFNVLEKIRLSIQMLKRSSAKYQIFWWVLHVPAKLVMMTFLPFLWMLMWCNSQLINVILKIWIPKYGIYCINAIELRPLYVPKAI